MCKSSIWIYVRTCGFPAKHHIDSAFLILVAESNFHIAAVYNICCILTEQEEDDYDVMQDPEFLQSVLENLPGVDPNNEAIRNAMGSLASQTGNKPDGKKDEEKKKWGMK